jgi:hypothetical protein
MDLVKWIDKNIEEIKETKEYGQFFSAEMTVIDLNRYLFNAEKGIDIVMSDSMIITAIHLFSGNTLESKRFQGVCVHDINFEMNCFNVEKILGNPNKKGGGYTDIFGQVPRWDKYYFDTYSLHLQYSPSTDKIDLITIGSLKLEPYLNSAFQ